MASPGRVELTTIDVIAALPRCKDCRLWEQADSTVTRGWGQCLATCNGSKGFGRNPLTKSRALAEGEDGYSAVLETAPDFGCVQFQPREGAA